MNRLAQWFHKFKEGLRERKMLAVIKDCDAELQRVHDMREDCDLHERFIAIRRMKAVKELDNHRKERA